MIWGGRTLRRRGRRTCCQSNSVAAAFAYLRKGYRRNIASVHRRATAVRLRSGRFPDSCGGSCPKWFAHSPALLLRKGLVNNNGRKEPSLASSITSIALAQPRLSQFWLTSGILPLGGVTREAQPAKQLLEAVPALLARRAIHSGGETLRKPGRTENRKNRDIRGQGSACTLILVFLYNQYPEEFTAV